MNGLNEILRPKTFEDIVGQEHILGKGAFLRLAIENRKIYSMIFYGPPGCGKSSTMELINTYTDYEVYHFNGAFASVKEIKKILEYAKKVKEIKKILLFVDEIHRFNKKQQDIFLPGIEAGDYVLIGATTENPYKMINEALLSRVRIIAFKKLSKENIVTLLRKASEIQKISLTDEAEEFVSKVSNGDARFAINLYEVLSFIAKSEGKNTIDKSILELYSGEEKYVFNEKEHYNLASAFIKSIRGSDPDAALYYLARMLEEGEDPRFIARRLIILASEDIGLADPMALVIAASTAYAVEYVGLPECVLNLSECVIYLSTAPKSNSATVAIGKAREIAKETKDIKVPRHLLNFPGSGYIYPHDYGGFVRKSYLPKELSDKIFYFPKSIGKEKRIKEIVETLWKGVKDYGSVIKTESKKYDD
ncbi:replication-associated recombination protein A [Thermosipho atlanticus]|uniref:Putative ATPase n=1 Tax=Thermosipho atlanticus DSM 15807 TaxID=1123380 RepID=A0A1M5RZA9_9BACT|nr:replication-associated recombination protein A [Thermosipho atlanticus]SHH31692.1 putative ATPase [Thermosipho atlanticus DSM 15807]